MFYGLSPDLFTIMSVYNVHPFSHACGLEQSSQCEINMLQPVAMVTVANDWRDDLFLGWVYESHTDHVSTLLLWLMMWACNLWCFISCAAAALTADRSHPEHTKHDLMFRLVIWLNNTNNMCIRQDIRQSVHHRFSSSGPSYVMISVWSPTASQPRITLLKIIECTKLSYFRELSDWWISPWCIFAEMKLNDDIPFLVAYSWLAQ